MMISFLSFAARSSYSCHCYFSCNRRIMVVSQKAGYASCSKTFNWKHYGYGCSAGTTLHASSKILHNDSFFFNYLMVQSLSFQMQVTLGISTLLSYVPVSLGAAHQAGALTLLTFMILLNHTVRRPSPSLLKTLPSVAKMV